MMWFKVSVEDKVTGIRAVHYVQAVYPSTAREQEESKGRVSPSLIMRDMS
jgi:hypothetical protein